MQPYERLWERLLLSLADLGEMEARSDGITITARDGTVVELLITPDEWEEFVTVPYGDFATAARVVRHSIEHLGKDERYLVYDGCYDLVGSATPQLPTDRADEEMAQRIAEIRRETLMRGSAGTRSTPGRAWIGRSDLRSRPWPARTSSPASATRRSSASATTRRTTPPATRR